MIELLIKENVKNESSKILLGYTILMIVIAIGFASYENQSYIGEWKEKLAAKIILNKEMIANNYDDVKSRELAFENQVLQYRIDNNIPPYDDFSIYVLKKINRIRLIIVSMIAVLVSSVFGAEYANNTIILYFTQGINKKKLILAKFLYCFFLTLFVLFISIAMFYLASFMMLKEKVFSEYFLFVKYNRVYQVATTDVIIRDLLILMICLLTYTIIVMLLCVVLKGQTLPLLLSLLFAFLGDSLTNTIPIKENVKAILLPNVLSELTACIDSTESLYLGKYAANMAITFLYGSIMVVYLYLILDLRPFGKR